MKREDVKVDGTYLAKVNGGVVPVRITAEKWTGSKHTGWLGVNTLTNRSVRIKTAQRLRGPVESGEGADAGATTAHEGEGGKDGAATPAGKGGKKGPKTAKAEKVVKAPKAKAAPTTLKARKAAKEPKAPKQPKPAKPKKTSALDAAALVLADARTPMKPKDMIATMEAKGLWTSPGGKTPEATLYAAIIREIRAKGKEARFRKTERGTFVSTGVTCTTTGKEA